jgi:HPt (histidine-containing phosphotransfer) domain-containing protein
VPDELDDVLDQATLDSLVDSVGGDIEFLAELIDTYVADAPLQLEALNSALAAGDVAELVRPAHTLKSASASLGALGLAERCRQLEQSAKTGSLEGAAQTIDGIAAEVERVVNALERTKRSFAA